MRVDDDVDIDVEVSLAVLELGSRQLKEGPIDLGGGHISPTDTLMRNERFRDERHGWSIQPARSEAEFRAGSCILTAKKDKNEVASAQGTKGVNGKYRRAIHSGWEDLEEKAEGLIEQGER